MRTEGSPRGARPGSPGPGAKLARGARAWGPWATGPGDWGARTKASPKARSENIRKRALEKGPREAWNQAPPGPGAKMARGTQPGDLGQSVHSEGSPRSAGPGPPRPRGRAGPGDPEGGPGPRRDPGDWPAQEHATERALKMVLAKRGTWPPWAPGPSGPAGPRPGDLGQEAQETGGLRKPTQKHATETCTQKGPRAPGPNWPGAPAGSQKRYWPAKDKEWPERPGPRPTGGTLRKRALRKGPGR